MSPRVYFCLPIFPWECCDVSSHGCSETRFIAALLTGSYASTRCCPPSKPLRHFFMSMSFPCTLHGMTEGQKPCRRSDQFLPYRDCSYVIVSLSTGLLPSSDPPNGSFTNRFSGSTHQASSNASPCSFTETPASYKGLIPSFRRATT